MEQHSEIAAASLITGEIQTEEQVQLQEEACIQQEKPSGWMDDAGMEIIRATRSWIQYGTVGFAVTLIVIGALEALLGR